MRRKAGVDNFSGPTSFASPQHHVSDAWTPEVRTDALPVRGRGSAGSQEPPAAQDRCGARLVVRARGCGRVLQREPGAAERRSGTGAADAAAGPDVQPERPQAVRRDRDARGDAVVLRVEPERPGSGSLDAVTAEERTLGEERVVRAAVRPRGATVLGRRAGIGAAPVGRRNAGAGG